MKSLNKFILIRNILLLDLSLAAFLPYMPRNVFAYTLSRGSKIPLYSQLGVTHLILHERLPLLRLHLPGCDCIEDNCTIGFFWVFCILWLVHLFFGVRFMLAGNCFILFYYYGDHKCYSTILQFTKSISRNFKLP